MPVPRCHPELVVASSLSFELAHLSRVRRFLSGENRREMTMGIWGSLAARLRRGETVRPSPPPAAPVSLHLVPIDPGERPDVPFGIWPDDIDAVPAWRIEVERKAEHRGLTIPSYRTRRQFEEAVEACAAALREPAPRVILEPLAPAEAARTFLAWIRDQNRCGEFTDQKLKDAYAEHCFATNQTGVDDSQMRKHLIDLAGVSKGLSEKKVSGRRHRPTVWKLGPSLSKIVEDRRLAA